MKGVDGVSGWTDDEWPGDELRTRAEQLRTMRKKKLRAEIERLEAQVNRLVDQLAEAQGKASKWREQKQLVADRNRALRNAVAIAHTALSKVLGGSGETDGTDDAADPD